MEEKKSKKKKKHKALRIFAKIMLGLLVFVLLLFLFVRSPWGQDIIIDRVVSSVAEKTDTRIELEKAYVGFSGAINIQGLYVEDKSGDTLIYSQSLKAEIPLWPLVTGGGITVNSADWNGLRVNLKRQDSITGFNYQFLVDAYASEDTIAKPADTTTLNLSLGSLHFSNFHITYADAVSGTDATLKLEEFNLKMEELDLEKMKFHVGNAQLAGANISFSQTKTVKQPEDTTTAPMPFVIVDRLTLENVKTRYNSAPDSILAKADIGEFLLEMPLANLAEKKVEINQLLLNNSDILVKMAATEVTKDTSTVKNPKTDGFLWPEWQVKIKDFMLDQNRISYLVNGEQPKKGVFNPNAIALERVNLHLNDFYLNHQKAGVHFNNLSFTEASGLTFKKLTFNAKITDEQLRVQNLMFQMNQNHLEGQFSLNYPSVKGLIENPEIAEINLNFPKLELHVNDAFMFQPALRDNEQLRALRSHPIAGNLQLDGSLAHLNIPEFQLHWGQNLTIGASGSLQNPMEPESMVFNIPQFNVDATRAALSKFIEEDSLGIAIPENIKLSGNFNGTVNNITAQAQLKLPEGEITMNGNFKNQEHIAFNANLQVVELPLGKLLKNPELGTLSLALKTTGQGKNINTLNAQLDSKINFFEYSGYAFENVNLTGALENGSGAITMDYLDENLDLDLNTMVNLDSVASTFDVTLNLKGADLKALGLSNRAIKTSAVLQADYEMHPEGFDLNSEINQGVIVYDDRSYLLGDVTLMAHVRTDTTSVKVENNIVHLNLQSNASPVAFASALQEHFKSYISEEIEIQDTIAQPVQLQLQAKINQSSVLNDVLLPSLKRLDTVNISVDFNQKTRNLNAMVSVPFVDFSGSQIDSLEVLVNSDKDNFTSSLGFNSINAGPVAINRTLLTGNIANDKLNMEFESYAADSLLVHVQSTLNSESDSIYFHVNPSDLLLNGKEWEIPENNRVVFAKNYLIFEDFRLQRGDREMEVSTKLPNIEKEHIGIVFRDFPLVSVLSFLNPKEDLASGALQGNFIIEEPFGSTGLLAALNINDFQVMQVPLGNLNLDAEAVGGGEYVFDLGLQNGGIELALTGDYLARKTGAELNLQLDLNALQLEAIEKFADGAVTQTNGYISGDFTVNGTTTDPVYQGEFQFHDAQFTVAMLNAPFSITNETLAIDTTAVYFNDFNIQDSNSSGLVLDGEIKTTSFVNPEFNLTMQAEDFQLLNSAQDDNDLYYGKAIFDVDASLQGDLNLPIVNMTLNVDPETNLTYVIPKSELNVVARDGVVVFVNRADTTAILTRGENEEMTMVSGMIIDAVINISENSAFTVVIDEQTGDNLRVLGEGSLNFSISENGRTHLAGRYELTGGHYEMNLYGLVNRRFEIVPGGSISWFGDPFDANLDITALYRVETSAYNLMATQIAGSNAQTQGQYRQELPFLVYLNVNGRLMQPELTFGIDMPEDEQGSLGGQVYSRVQQLNEQENELNKQVFSLLVLNRFYPQSNSYGGEGGALTIARDNLNQAVSDQLNMFSDQLLKDTGVALNFGLDSYTDYQGESPQQRTALEISAEKRFFDDRLVVEVGSEVNIQGSDPAGARSNPLIGNVNIQYLLTEDGKFRLKAFRRNTFENIIDGQVIINGIALIFMREFNEIEELWIDATTKTKKENNQ